MNQLAGLRKLFLFVMLAASSWAASALAADDNLNIVFTTTNAGGAYGNRHVHVVWLTTESGVWVCTVGNDSAQKRALWANARASSLATWYKTNPQPKDDVNARTGATPTAYTTYNINWNWRKLDGTLIPDGTYKLLFECTNADSGNPHNYTSFTITKGRSNWSIGPVTQGGYANVKLTYTVADLSLANLAAAQVTDASAVVGGSVAGTNDKPYRLYVYWGVSDGQADPGVWDYRADLGEIQDGSFTVALTHLTQGQVYYYRCYAVGESQSLWAAQTQQFTARTSPVIFRKGDMWQYFEGYTYPGDGWNDLGFTLSSAWKTGPTGIGFGDGDDATVLTMANLYVTLYMRYEFTVPDPTTVTALDFKVDYDDGFVAYINGQEVARRGVDPGQTVGTTALDHSASANGGSVESINLNDYLGALKAGDNVFAVEVHNSNLRSTDLTMIPELTATGLRSAQPNLSVIRVLDFGDVRPGGVSELPLTVTNTGQQPLTVASLRIVGLMPEAFSVQSTRNPPFDLQPGEEETLLLRFLPAALQAYAYTNLMIGSNDWDEPLIAITLTGRGVQSP